MSSVRQITAGQKKQFAQHFLAAIEEYNPSREQAQAVLSDPAAMGELADTYRPAFRRLFDGKAVPVQPQDFPVWKTVNLGTRQDNVALRHALNGRGFRISDWATEILDKVEVAPEPTALDLVLVTVAELGFPDGAYHRDIYAKAQSVGLALCPAEVGPQLRLQHPDQRYGEWIWVGMDPIVPIVGACGRPCVFDVEHGCDGRWLGSFYADPDIFRVSFSHWVFARK